MNRKLLVIAVASVVAAPAAYADISMYGRISNGIVINDQDDTQNMSTLGSRFGIKGSGDIGNGMSALAHYEFSTTSDNAKVKDNDGDENSTSGIGRRLAYVGLSGPFGTVTVGQQWSSYYSVSGHLSQNYWSGPAPVGPSRTGNTIQYSNSVGPVALEIDARVDDSSDGGGNGVGFGLNFSPMDSVSVGFGFDSNDDNNQELMVGYGSMSFGMLGIVVGHEQGSNYKGMADQDVSNTVLGLSASLSDQLGILLSLGQKTVEPMGGAEMETDTFGLGGHYLLGGGLRIWSEYVSKETTGEEDSDQFILAIRMDF